MKTKMDPATGGLNDTAAERLKKHALAFRSPLCDPMAGIPLGNGDTGSLVWFEDNGIHIQVNHTDLWEDSTWTDPVYNSDEDENISTLRHGGEIVLKFHAPIFHPFYQKNFDARLSLSDAVLRLTNETAFSSLRAECFASTAEKVSFLDLVAESADDDFAELSFMRWGSRSFWRWVGMAYPDPTKGLGGTAVETDGNEVYITQHLNGTDFCFGGMVIAEGAAFEPLCGHNAVATLPKGKRVHLRLLWNISVGGSVDEAKKVAENALHAAAEKSYDDIRAEHIAAWHRFWNRSYIAIPDDFLENCWYLDMYTANCECRGKYPPHFTSGIWQFNHDYLAWAYFFHYNTQHMFAPLAAAGHPELCEGYLRMRRDGLETAKRFAETVKGHEGAFYHDVCDRYGRGALYDHGNCTPGMELALQMWKQYRFTGDEAFLENTVLPVLRETAKFYLSLLEKGEDGLYHTHGTTVYEGTPPYTDSITDKMAIIAGFRVLAKYSSGEERAQLLDVLDHLPDFLTVPLGEDEVKDGKLVFGVGAGEEVLEGGTVFATGLDDEGNPVRRLVGDPEKNKIPYGFPDTELSPLYPTGVISLKDKGSREFNILLNQVRLHGVTGHTHCIMWCMEPIYLARLGLGDKLYDYLPGVVGKWIVYPNGFGADGDCGRDENGGRAKYYHVANNKDRNTPLTLEKHLFRRFDYEPMPIVAHAIGESLLQSHDGVIRVCPATRADDRAVFTLYAEGGFKVTADVQKEDCLIAVENLRGEDGYLALPERFDLTEIKVYAVKDGHAPTEIPAVFRQNEHETVLTLDGFGAGETRLISSRDLADWQQEPAADYPENEHYKTMSDAMLGTPDAF